MLSEPLDSHLHTKLTFKACFIMRILTIHFSYLRNETHHRFLSPVKKLFETCSTVANLATALLSQFYTLLAFEGGDFFSIGRSIPKKRQDADLYCMQCTKSSCAQYSRKSSDTGISQD
jgi:hypothetical protein